MPACLPSHVRHLLLLLAGHSCSPRCAVLIQYAATLRAMGRVASGEAQGRRGASRFRGVSRSQLRDGYWRARIGADREEVYNGPSEEAAARAYDRAALRRWGRCAGSSWPQCMPPACSGSCSCCAVLGWQGAIIIVLSSLLHWDGMQNERAQRQQQHAVALTTATEQHAVALTAAACCNAQCCYP